MCNLKGKYKAHTKLGEQARQRSKAKQWESAELAGSLTDNPLLGFYSTKSTLSLCQPEPSHGKTSSNPSAVSPLQLCRQKQEKVVCVCGWRNAKLRLELRLKGVWNAAQRELVCSSWGCVCLCVYVDRLECLCHGASQTFACERCPKIDIQRTAELVW